MQRSFALFAFLMPAAMLAASNSAPVALPIVDTIPAARDVPWLGTIELAVDATDVVRSVFQVEETIPVSAAGPLTLLYPKWIPGSHSPWGPIERLSGIRISSGGLPVSWRRDPVDVFAFHVDVPAGSTALSLQYQFLGATDAAQGSIVTTPDMLNLDWSTVVLYPAGHFARQIPVGATLRLPAGWKAFSALDVAAQESNTTHYRVADLDTLVDSPVFAGANSRVETLAPGVHLDIVADLPQQLAATGEELQLNRNLVDQAVKLFGSQHYDHYDFLLALSDRQTRVGREHHRSLMAGVGGKYFTDWKDVSTHDLLAHEYAHSWNGKFRRPADLWTPDFRTPMQGSLLWVYEGQTQLWGYVLAARSGLLSKADTLDALANTAFACESNRGRTWRSLEDTTSDPVMSHRGPQPWTSWQRFEDYYNEGLLVWLDVDSLIRQLSGDTKSLDDFARAFFGMNDRDWGEMTYTFDDVVRVLATVQPYDWAKFLRERLDATSEHAPLDGLTRGGYKLAFSDTPGEWRKSVDKRLKFSNLMASGGLAIGAEGEVAAVLWDGPAFNAGLSIGTRIIAMDGRAFELENFKDAIKARKSPISLLVRSGDVFRTVSFSYAGGLQYPKLEKIGSGVGSLDELLTPRR
jgi:predicted metalloprotease with PDZ domain